MATSVSVRCGHRRCDAGLQCSSGGRASSKWRRPSCAWPDFAIEGGLMAYGVEFPDMFRYAAAADKIIKVRVRRTADKSGRRAWTSSQSKNMRGVGLTTPVQITRPRERSDRMMRECPLLAESGHGRGASMSAIGGKSRHPSSLHMSAYDRKRTSAGRSATCGSARCHPSTPHPVSADCNSYIHPSAYFADVHGGMRPLESRCDAVSDVLPARWPPDLLALASALHASGRPF